MEREEERHMQNQINTLAEKVASLNSLQKANHEENRRDIHRLSNGQQSLIDTLTIGLEKIAEKIDHRVSPVEDSVHALQLQWARATGYAIGISAAGAFVFQVVKALLSRMGVH